MMTNRKSLIAEHFLGVLSIAIVTASVFLPLVPAMAAGADNGATELSQRTFFERRNKVLIFGLFPGQVVSVYGVDGTDTPEFTGQGVPSGQHAGDYVGPQDGKPLEIYIPLSPVSEGPHARVSRLFLWSGDSGWDLIASLAPTESFPDTLVWVG